MLAIYNALQWSPTGKVAVKLSTGEPPASNYLRPELIADVVKEVDGTIVECNTAYGGSQLTENYVGAAFTESMAEAGKAVSDYLGNGERIVYINVLNNIRKKPLFRFDGFSGPHDRDTDPNLFMRFLKNLDRNIKATGLYFLIGIVLSAVFQRYILSEAMTALFGGNEAFGQL